MGPFNLNQNWVGAASARRNNRKARLPTLLQTQQPGSRNPNHFNETRTHWSKIIFLVCVKDPASRR
jgi:hypothetical protein